MDLLDQQLAAGLRGDFVLGWRLAEELKTRDPHDPRAQFNRAWYEMMRGRLGEGLRLLDSGRWLKVFGDSPLPTNKPIYRDQDLQGRHLLLCAEGGLGDEIINVRFAREFARRGAKVTVTCDPSLKSVFARVPGVSSVVGHKAAPEVYHDFWVPAMSAARVLEHEYDTIENQPYINSSADYVEKWRPKIEEFFGSQKLRVGLRFYGNPKFEHEQFRRFPPDLLKRAVGTLKWINLQKEETDLNLQTWEDTLAVIDLLDLVITSCTSVAHAAAAMGKMTWVVLPILPYYVWALPGPTSPWYRNVKLFRQKQFGNWEQPFLEIADELRLLWRR